jgi:two-component system, NarL family, invasion response regulator UvrY
MIRLIIADDHPVVRSGLRQIATLAPEIEVVGEAATGEEVLRQLRLTDPDVLLCDVTMPGPGIVRLLAQVRRARPALRVLVLSVHPEDLYAVRLIKAGAAGYLNKDRSPEELVQGIRRVHAGRRYVSAQLAEELAARVGRDSMASPHERLSDREFEVLCRLGAGFSVKEVALALGLSSKTVSTYRARLLEKMRLRTKADLVHYVHSRGLVA